MKILKTHIVIELPLLPGMEKKSDDELEKQQEKFWRNHIFSSLPDQVDVVTKVVEKP